MLAKFKSAKWKTEQKKKVKNLLKNTKQAFNNKWKEIAMKLQIDIKPEDLLSFDKMIALPTIKVIYWLGLACVAIGGLITIAKGTFSELLLGIAIIIVGAIAWRLVCEAAILLFGIYDRLGDIRNSLNAHNEGQNSALIAKEKTSSEKTKK